jgi:hypothetical protein
MQLSAFSCCLSVVVVATGVGLEQEPLVVPPTLNLLVSFCLFLFVALLYVLLLIKITVNLLSFLQKKSHSCLPFLEVLLRFV